MVRSAVTLVVLLALLAACGGNPTPAPAPTRSAAPTVDTSAPPTPPPLPAAAKGTTDAAVDAFARHYIDLVNFTMHSGATDPLAAVSAPTCQSCTFIISRSRRIYAAGGSVQSGGWLVNATSVARNQPTSRKYVDLQIQETAQNVAENADEPSKHYGGGKHLFTMLLAFREGGWIVTRLDLDR